jgi:hypothetical protein
MSYEGYEQCICKNGHYFELDVMYFWHEPENAVCDECEAPAAWRNSVDTTNYEEVGEIPLELLQKHFLISPEEPGKEAVYRIPTQEETNPLRHRRDNGKLVTIPENDIASVSRK